MQKSKKLLYGILSLILLIVVIWVVYFFVILITSTGIISVPMIMKRAVSLLPSGKAAVMWMAWYWLPRIII